MDSILSYILTAVKKAKYIVFSQAGQIYGRQNKVGCIAAFDCALPAEYDQQKFPQELQLNERHFQLESVDRNVLVFSSDTSKGRKLRVAVMFVPEYQAYLAVGFTETALQLDYYEQMSFVRSEF